MAKSQTAKTAMVTAESDQISRRQAVIDIGSNSLRLVVFEGHPRAPLPIFNEKVMCGMGRKLISTGRLDPEGVELALANMPRFAAAIEALSVDHVQVVATSAVRDAEDGPAFVDAVAEVSGLPVRVLSGEEEAYYSALGVLASLPSAAGIIGDLGGGSLELIRIADGAPAESITLPLGALRLNELTAAGEPLQPHIKAVLKEVPWIGDSPNQVFYAVGGAWRTIGRVHAAQSRYGLRILDTYSAGAPDFRDFLRLMAQQQSESLLRMPQVSAKRVGTIPAAALILRRLLKVTQANHITFSASGLREGLLFDHLSAAEKMQEPLVAAASTIGGRFGRFSSLSETMCRWLTPLFAGDPHLSERLIAAAAHLGDIGWSDHPDYRAEHVRNRTLTLPVAGMAHSDRIMLALALFVRYGGKPEKTPDHAAYEEQVSDTARTSARALGQALRLGYKLSAGQTWMLGDSKLQRQGEELRLSVPGGDAAFTGEAIAKRLTELGSTLDLTPRLMPRDTPALSVAQ